MSRPLKLVGADMQMFSDANLAFLAYLTRAAYAAQVNASGTGAIYVGGTGTTIGSASDTSSTQSINTNPGTGFGTITQYPGYPAIGGETDASYTYKQNRTVSATFPSTATLNASSYLVWDGATGVRLANTLADFTDEIINEAVNQMKNGDQVGTYRISTASPGTGWTDKGVWFADTTYSAGTTNYRLYLRTSNTGTAWPQTGMMKIGTAGVIQDTTNITTTSAIVAQILLPILQMRVSSGDFLYSVDGAAGGNNRGSFNNTKQTGTSYSQASSPSGPYSSIATPSGTAVLQNTWFLNLS